MRTTISLSDETHDRLLSHARDSGQTLSSTVDRLLRQAMHLDDPAGIAPIAVDPKSLLPVVAYGKPITLEDVRNLDDDA